MRFANSDRGKHLEKSLKKPRRFQFDSGCSANQVFFLDSSYGKAQDYSCNADKADLLKYFESEWTAALCGAGKEYDLEYPFAKFNDSKGNLFKTFSKSGFSDGMHLTPDSND